MERVEHISFKIEEQALTKEDIDNFLVHHNVQLPDEFIALYLNHNGGWPNANWNDGEENIIPITRFLPIKYGKKTISDVITQFTNQQLGLGGRIPFAENAVGGYFFIATDEEDFGRVFYADVIPSEDGTKKLLDWQNHCRTFNEFMERFMVDDNFGKIFDVGSGRYIEDFESYALQYS